MASDGSAAIQGWLKLWLAGAGSEVPVENVFPPSVEVNNVRPELLDVAITKFSLSRHAAVASGLMKNGAPAWLIGPP